MIIKTVLVVGATGQQGGALIDALRESCSDWKIYGLTRNTSSAAAKKLQDRHVTMIEGDMSKPDHIFAQIGERVGTVFAMSQSGEREEGEGKAMVDGAIANGVQHYVFTSVDRGGPSNSPKDPTFVPHFISKHNIELYLVQRASAAGSHMGWTILRPVTFMDNFMPGVMSGFMGRIMEQMNGLRLQFISAKDIGKVAALVLNDTKLYNGKALTLASDSLNYQSVCVIFREELGIDVPLAPVQAIPSVGAPGNDARSEDVAKMVQWFNNGGYNSSLDEVQAQWPNGNPGLEDLRTWIRTTSKWAKQGPHLQS